MKTFTINVDAKKLIANTDIYNTNEIDIVHLNVLDNDVLGVEPTIITSVDTTGFILGSVAIDVGDETLAFTPNGNFGSSSFSYTITDSLSRTSTGIVHIIIPNP